MPKARANIGTSTTVGCQPPDVATRQAIRRPGDFQDASTFEPNPETTVRVRRSGRHGDHVQTQQCLSEALVLLVAEPRMSGRNGVLCVDVQAGFRSGLTAGEHDEGPGLTYTHLHYMPAAKVFRVEVCHQVTD